jgi:putative acetyltransferase
MAGEGPALEHRSKSDQTVAGLRSRLDRAARELARVARSIAARDGWDERWLDVLDNPPKEKTYGGAIAHVVTHSMHHRAQLLQMLRRLGVNALPEGDVLSWEQHRGCPVVVRFEQPHDVPAIHDLHTSAFPTEGEACLVDHLRASGRLTVSLVALDADRIVGHIAFSPVSVEGAAGGLGLGPVAVAPDCRRRGVAAELVRTGLTACRHSGCALVVVLGSPAYYGRFGFNAATKFGLRSTYTDGPAFQALPLRRWNPSPSGRVVTYAPEFAELG